MREIIRLLPLLLAASALPGAARAQGPVPGMLPQQGDTNAPAAGQVPTLGQQPNGLVPGQSGGGEPARAPGAKADQGTVLPGSNDNSGTTTVYAPSTDADKEVRWPCVQPKVASIGAGTIWSGPNLDQGKDWEDDNETAELAQTLASRRTTLDEANDLIGAFAKKAGPDKGKKLTGLFVGTLDIINGNRVEILDRHHALRARPGAPRRAHARGIRQGSRRRRRTPTATGLGVAKDQINTDFAWDQRIFKERNQALSYVCETPSLLERRAFEIAKRIQAQI